jgi:steroid delta-isomerase-like uncharacterized protein
MTTTTTEENKELVKRVLEEAFSRGDVDVLEEVLADDFVAHAPSEPGHGAETQDRERLAEEIERNREAFPDMTFTVEEIVAEGDTVAVRWSARGTHEGELMGMEPTGEAVDMRGMNFLHIENGKIAEDWVLWDSLGMMQQLGIGPEPPAP